MEAGVRVTYSVVVDVDETVVVWSSEGDSPGLSSVCRGCGNVLAVKAYWMHFVWQLDAAR